MARMHCLFIGKHPCLCLVKDNSKASGTNWCCKWHRIGAYFVDLAAPIGAASGTELVPILLT